MKTRVEVVERAASSATHQPPPLLTSNHLAGAEMACQLAIAWHRSQPPSGFRSKEIRKLTDLIRVFARAVDHRNPYRDDPDSMPLDWGDEAIYRPIDPKPLARRPAPGFADDIAITGEERA